MAYFRGWSYTKTIIKYVTIKIEKIQKGKMRIFGGAKRDRTADLLHAMQALSQLSYSPIIDAANWN